MMEVATATPILGVISVGELSTTNLVPVPVWDAMEVALPTEIITPVRLALVVTVAALPVVLWLSVGKSAATAIESTPVEVVFFTMPVPRAPKNCAADSPLSVVPWTINLLANATFADPSTLLPAKLRAVSHLEAVAALPEVVVAVAALPKIEIFAVPAAIFAAVKLVRFAPDIAPKSPDQVPAVIMPTLVNEEAVTPAAKVPPVSVPAAAVTVMSAEPSNATPFMLRAVASFVAVAALPVKAPMKVVAVAVVKVAAAGVTPPMIALLIVPPLIIGAVKLLFVSVWIAVRVTIVSPEMLPEVAVNAVKLPAAGVIPPMTELSIVTLAIVPPMISTFSGLKPDKKPLI